MTNAPVPALLSGSGGVPAVWVQSGQHYRFQFFGRSLRAMPTYTYQCDSCGHGFEAVQRFADDPLTECPQCGASIRRVIQPVGVVFKGSGWYITDSRPKSAGDGGDGASAAKTKDKADSPAKADKAEKADVPAKTEKSPAKVAD